MAKERFPLLDLSFVKLKEYLREQGESVSHADRIMRWAFRKLAVTFEEMADLSSTLRQKLAESAELVTIKPLAESISADGQTRKVLFQLTDGKTIESTLMFYRKPGASRARRTVCVSSQVGCPVGCGFCATGQQGFERNLRPGEIIEQILFFRRLMPNILMENELDLSRPEITNIVFMGMGEPLANYANVRQAIGLLNSPQGLGLGFRQITLSTAGLVPQIQQLARDNLRMELAVSLHAATDEVRNLLVPINTRYPLAQLIPACQEYCEITGRRLFCEYALFDGVNDSETEAAELVRLLRDFNCSVNLILGNPTSSQEYQPSPVDRALAFQRKVIEGGIRCMTRASRGSDIAAGCGQLKSQSLANGKR